LSFFGNDAINRVNLHATIQALAQGGGGVFVFVFLLKAGVSAPLVFCALAGITITRFALRPLVLVVARRLGLRACLILGTVMEAALFPLLPLVHGPGPVLILVILVGAFGGVFYWTSLHAYFAALGDAKARGRQVGVRAAAAALANIAAPWAGGWALGALGPQAMFALAAGVQVLAVAPLSGAPDPPVARFAPVGGPDLRFAVRLQASDGAFQAGFYYVWQIALFITLGERFAGYGGAMALAGLVGAAASLMVGRLVDLGHARTSVVLAYGACALVAGLKAASLCSPALAVAANALAGVAALLLEPVMMSPIYNLAKASACPLRFHMATEGGWDLGSTAGCLAAAALTALGAPLSASVLLALVGASAGFCLLLRRPAAPERAGA
jgi:hypothetical protein